MRYFFYFSIFLLITKQSIIDLLFFYSLQPDDGSGKVPVNRKEMRGTYNTSESFRLFHPQKLVGSPCRQKGAEINIQIVQTIKKM
ncbi:hypothetical protein BS1321_13645 [Peribacillus simplex NBRC 15720 = DSM 1321]|uniref:Uncharacterized protein n=1 Tax=Peribacillus simplex NBRC 15720 = DSM 1321 TaxID=1349754 RepID=A0A223EHZ1_9BACI|nr:hypothetical protein BS1321_13645 [Peribacillus simplex NBRC 15720 = DSM 1321]